MEPVVGQEAAAIAAVRATVVADQVEQKVVVVLLEIVALQAVAA